MPTEIDFNHAPAGLVNTDDRAKVFSADLDRWRMIVAAMRNETEVSDKQSPSYFPNTNREERPHLRQMDSSVHSNQPKELASWIESQLPMKILSWNVGTKYNEKRQAYYWSAFQKHVRWGKGSYDIYCLQEVPNAPLGTNEEILHRFGLWPVFQEHYHVLHSKRNDYSFVCMVRKKFVTDPPECLTLSLEHYHPFAQKISMTTKAGNITLFNVHLLAFKEDLDKKSKEEKSRTSDRQKQIDALEGISKSGDYFCGDFNMIRDATKLRPGMNDIPWLKVADDADSTFFKVGANLRDKEDKEYDYIGVRQDVKPDPFKRTVLTPGISGSKGSWRHHPVFAEIAIP